ncbi:MAG: MFS transporter [Bacilli bacterium]|jgi:MFS family permease
MDNIKKFNLFVFLATFTRNLIEVFIPLILYNRGLTIDYIFLFLLLYYFFSSLLNFPLTFLSKRITFKWLIIISSFFISLSYYLLFLFPLTILILILIVFTHIINSHTYWLSRHYFALEVLSIKEIGLGVGKIIIFSELGLIPASYLGALLITYLNFKYVLLIVIMMYLITISPLFTLKERNKKKLSLDDGYKEIIKTIPKRNIYFYFLVQFRMIARYIFPLYIFIYVESNYKFVGIFNTLVGISSLFFVYFYSKKLDKEKKDYLILSSILLGIVWILKLNIFSSFIILIIAFLEGLVEKMYETTYNYNNYSLGLNYNSLAFVSYLEGLQNFFRAIIILIVIIFIKDLIIFLYLSSFMLIISSLIGFDKSFN